MEAPVIPIGQERLCSTWGAMVASGALPHGFLVVGQKGTGRKAFVRYCLSTLGLKTNDAFQNHPDVFFVQPLINEKTGVRADIITVGQAREMKMHLSRTAVAGMWRVCIIDEAEKLNESAANALLKFFEEPQIHTLLFVITGSPAAIPATVRSRMGVLTLDRPQPAAVAAWARALFPEHTPEAVDEAVRLAGGMPGPAWRLLQDTEHFARLRTQAAQLDVWMAEPERRWRIAETIEKECEDREAVLAWVGAWETRASEAFRGTGATRYARVLEGLEHIKNGIEHRVQKKMLFDQFVINSLRTV